MIDPTVVRVDVWWADLRAADVALAERLPPAERARALAPERPADRGRRLLAAALLQEAVASARGLGGADVAVGEHAAAGAGDVAGPFEVDRTCEECGEQHGRPVVAGGPHLSVSHAGTLVVVATCWAAPVGVDVERLERFEGDDAASAREWTAREARFKATGPGEVGAGTIAAVDGPLAGSMIVHLSPPATGYLASLAVVTHGDVVVTEHRGLLP